MLRSFVFFSLFKFAIVLNVLTKIVHPHLVEFGYPSDEEWLNLRYSLRFIGIILPCLTYFCVFLEISEVFRN